MAHRSALLTPAGRLLLAQRIVELGWPAATAAEAMGVSRSTAYKWARRYVEAGPEAMADRSTRPHRSPTRTRASVERRVIKLRVRDKLGPHQIGPRLGVPRSTVYAVLRRHGVSRLDHMDKPTGTRIRRYVRERPGELLHVDVKKLGRIPDGGGHRTRGRQAANQGRRRGLGYDYLHSAVDDHSRVVYSEILTDEKGPTCAEFVARAIAWFAQQGVHVERIMTDEAKNYVISRDFQAVLAAHGVKHKRTGPYRPQINGKVERFHLTLLREWAYKRPYTSNHRRVRTYQPWIDKYNQRRPHSALDGQSPMTVLVNKVRGNDN